MHEQCDERRRDARLGRLGIGLIILFLEEFFTFWPPFPTQERYSHFCSLRLLLVYGSKSEDSLAFVFTFFETVKIIGGRSRQSSCHSQKFRPAIEMLAYF
jgi:hypothetical protein